jgi:hypothetical protein
VPLAEELAPASPILALRGDVQIDEKIPALHLMVSMCRSSLLPVTENPVCILALEALRVSPQKRYTDDQDASLAAGLLGSAKAHGADALREHAILRDSLRSQYDYFIVVCGAGAPSPCSSASAASCSYVWR